MSQSVISIDFLSPKEPFKKPWEEAIGSCHAYTLLREDVRNHFKMLHDECGFRSVRCHGLFDDDMQVVRRNYKGEIEYSFFNIDCIYDWLISIGMKPFVELSFMPRVLASDPSKTVFEYKGIVSLPRKMEEWSSFIQAFISHTEERYGKEEVQKWYFEVWNEPNLGGDIRNFESGFFAGTQKDYFDLYRATALAIKKIDPLLKVGGPATSNNRWIKEMVAFCKDSNTSIDFISTHHYPTDVIFGDNPTLTDEMRRLNRDIDEAPDKEKARNDLFAFQENVWKYVPRSTCLEMEKKAKNEAGDLPLLYTEWQSLAGLHADGSFGNSFNLKTAIEARDYVEAYSFWCGSDIFEENPMLVEEFHGGFGLLTSHGIKKSIFYGFKMLHMMEGDIIKVPYSKGTLDAYLVSGKEEDYLLVINQNSLKAPIEEETGNILIQNYPYKIKSIRHYLVDDNHSNPLYIWENGYKDHLYLNKDEIDEISGKSPLFSEKIDRFQNEGNTLKIPFDLIPMAVSLYTISR